MEKQQIIRLAEAARRLGVSQKTARTYIKNGALPAFRLGKDWFVYPGELEKTIEYLTVGNANGDRKIAALVRENIDTIQAALIALANVPHIDEYTDMMPLDVANLANNLREVVDAHND